MLKVRIFSLVSCYFVNLIEVHKQTVSRYNLPR